MIAEKNDRIESLKKKIKSFIKKNVDPKILYHKKRRLNKLENELSYLKEDHKNDKTWLCFGSKKLFRAQFDLEANGMQPKKSG